MATTESRLLMDIYKAKEAASMLLTKILDKDRLIFSKEFENRVGHLNLKQIRRVYLTGVWSSLNAAKIALSFFREFPGIDAHSVSPNDLPELGTDPEALVIILSESGKTGDIIAATKSYFNRNPVSPTIAITENENSKLANIVRDKGEGVLRIYKGSDESNTTTKGHLNQILILFLLAIYLLQLKGGTQETLRVQIERGITTSLSVPQLINDTYEREAEIQEIADNVASLILSYSVSSTHPNQVLMNPSLLFIASPEFFTTLEEIRCKLIEHTRIPVVVDTSWNIKYGTICLLEPDNKIPALILLDLDDENDIRNLKESLGVAWSEIDVSIRESIISAVSKKLFFICTLSDKSVDWQNFPLGWVSLTKENTLVLYTGTSMLQKAIIYMVFSWFFVYYFTRALGRDPDDVHVEKVYRLGALFPERPVAEITRVTQLIESREEEVKELKTKLNEQDRLTNQLVLLGAFEWGSKVGIFFIQLILANIIWKGWLMTAQSIAAFISIYGTIFGILTLAMRKARKRLSNTQNLALRT